MNIRENIPIADLTTMRLGGAARYVIDIKTEDEVAEAYAFAAQKQLPVYVLGYGSNIIGRDKGFNGVVLVNQIKGMGVQTPERTGNVELFSYSGEILDDFVTYGTKLGYSGMEAMSAIPGTVGAAPVQNVGAYGQDIAQSLVSVTAYSTIEQDFVEFVEFALNTVEGFREKFWELDQEHQVWCKQLLFPDGFSVSRDKKVYTPTISDFYLCINTEKSHKNDSFSTVLPKWYTR